MSKKLLQTTLLVVLLGGTAGLRNAEAADCVGSGSIGKWGNSMTGQFPIAAGQSCSYGFAFDGEMYESGITQPPQHGTATMTNMSTVEYRANAGFKGKDTFKVRVRGKGPNSAGVSVITLNALVR